MKGKRVLLLGIILILLGVFKIVDIIIPENIIQYIFNYQILILLLGIYLIIKKGIDNIGGIFLIILSIYLYIEEFLSDEYTIIILPILLILFGSLLILKYIKDNKKGE